MISTERKAKDNQVQYKHMTALTHKLEETTENTESVHCLAELLTGYANQIGMLALNAVFLHMGMLNTQKKR